MIALLIAVGVADRFHKKRMIDGVEQDLDLPLRHFDKQARLFYSDTADVGEFPFMVSP